MKLAIRNVTIGCDIEVFLMNKDTNEIVSAEGYVKGSKHRPFNFDKSDKYFAISLDNVAAEFCIPPVRTTEDWIKNITHSLKYINESIPSHLCSVALPAANLDEKYLQTPNALTFGCEADACVWTRSKNKKPSAENKNLRSCGGHIHIGYSLDDLDRKEIQEHNEAIVKAMDLFVGIPSVIQEPDNERKSLYGKAGCFRFKPYGVEYRTVSNYYLENEKLTGWAFDNSVLAVEYLNEEGLEKIDRFGSDIQQAINNTDRSLAEHLIQEFNLKLA